MTDAPPPPRPWLPRVLFVLSAAVAAVALRAAWEAPLAAAAGLSLLLAVVAARWLSRRRTRRLLRSGDVESVLDRWSPSLEKVPHPETMGPLMTATALAANGWTERARAVLQTAERGPAWEAAVEHRLFLEALLLTFEGDCEHALRRADELAALPIPSSEPFLIERIRVLRRAVGALARAFCHQTRPGDRQLMMEAGNASPLVHWAMRYGAAIEAVDTGELIRARLLLAEAPQWPNESRFATFHAEIRDEVARLAETSDDDHDEEDASSPAEIEAPQDAPRPSIADEESQA